ncbi:Polygalacturonase [Bienertia sinuspersici]
MKSIMRFLSIIIILNFTTLTIAKDELRTRSNRYYNVVDLGAKPNSNIDSSNGLKAAWEMACASTGRSTIFIPQGRYLIRSALKYSGKECKSSGINFVIKGTIVAPTDFHILGNLKTWVSFEYVDGVTITGGVFDGQGAGLWACKRSRKGGCPRGISTLGFANSKNVEINGVTSLNSQLFHIVINGCKDVKVQGVRVIAPSDSPNTDGIHVQLSSGVTILNSRIATGDDCISIGSGTTSLWIEEIKCGPGHGISIGSLAKTLNEAGVQNITVKTATFTNTQNGVRIKSWGRPSNGYVRNVLFQHLTMVNAQNPIVIDQNYCPRHKGCPGQDSGVRISSVTYKDIHGSSATPIAIKLDCSSKYPCSGIKMEDIHLTHKNEASLSTCANTAGSSFGVIQPKSCL